MKYALVDNKKEEATKGLKGVCPVCNSELIANCGEIRVHHWSHKGTRNCDPWWENETPWHRSWKEHFPTDWQEVVHFSDEGEKHIADVKTGQEWVLEFQHSYLKPEERRSRDAFYNKLVWVIDGTRRKTDIKQFKRALDGSSLVAKSPFIVKPHSPGSCRLLKEWMSSPSFVFFDFQDLDTLWFLLPNVSTTEAYLGLINREEFINYHVAGVFEDFYYFTKKNFVNPLKSKIRKLQNPTSRYNVISNAYLRRNNKRL